MSNIFYVRDGREFYSTRIWPQGWCVKWVITTMVFDDEYCIVIFENWTKRSTMALRSSLYMDGVGYIRSKERILHWGSMEELDRIRI